METLEVIFDSSFRQFCRFRFNVWTHSHRS